MPDSRYFPRWARDINSLRSFAIKAHGIASNIPQAGAGGSSVHIGIVDSASRLPSNLTDGFTVRQGNGHAFIDSSDDETTHHCTPVFCLASTYCPDATFSLYQTVREDRKLPLEAFSDAITAAIEDGVDILNISAGDPWDAPVELNPNIQEAKRAIREDVIVVASAGNEGPESERRLPVHCPAALKDVIAVGGFVSRCPATPGKEPADEPRGPYYVRSDSGEADGEVDGPYCGEQGCVDGKGCIPNKREERWEHNVLSTGGKPDVLAPVIVPEAVTPGDPFLRSGTSFAAPIVTGALGGILDELRRSKNDDLNPYQAREAVIEGGSPIDEGKLPKFDAMGTRQFLGIT